MKKCGECGIGIKLDNGKIKCAKYNTIEDLKNEGNCLYFIDFQYELDGELMNPLQHILIKEREVTSKSMKGPI